MLSSKFEQLDALSMKLKFFFILSLRDEITAIVIIRRKIFESQYFEIISRRERLPKLISSIVDPFEAIHTSWMNEKSSSRWWKWSWSSNKQSQSRTYNSVSEWEFLALFDQTIDLWRFDDDRNEVKLNQKAITCGSRLSQLPPRRDRRLDSVSAKSSQM